MRIYNVIVFPDRNISMSREVRGIGDAVVIIRNWNVPEEAISRVKRHRNGETFEVRYNSGTYKCQILMAKGD